MRCPNCGAEFTSRFCPECGRPAGQSGWNPGVPPVLRAQVASQKRRWTAALLCLFLGVFGIHRFYVGKVGSGVVYLLTLGVFGIGVVIDLIAILCGGVKDSYGFLLTK